MSLSDLASLGSFVSAVAVFVSLILLYFQLRQLNEQVKQAEKNQRGVLNQGFVNRITEDIRWWADSPFNELHTRVITGDTTFTAEELSRLDWGLRVAILNLQDAYLQHKGGLVDNLTLDTGLQAFKKRWLAHPVYRALWLETATGIAPEFRVVIDAILRAEPPAKPNDITTEFKKNLATVTG